GVQTCALPIAENLIGLIPGVGWYKKGNRALNVMGGKDRGSETTPGPVRADGDQPGDNRRSDDETTRPPARPCRGNSFVPGTLVLLADGTYAPIETITVGDDVWAFDPRTGTEGPPHRHRPAHQPQHHHPGGAHR